MGWGNAAGWTGRNFSCMACRHQQVLCRSENCSQLHLHPAQHEKHFFSFQFLFRKKLPFFSEMIDPTSQVSEANEGYHGGKNVQTFSLPWGLFMPNGNGSMRIVMHLAMAVGKWRKQPTNLSKLFPISVLFSRRKGSSEFRLSRILFAWFNSKRNNSETAVPFTRQFIGSDFRLPRFYCIAIPGAHGGH